MQQIICTLVALERTMKKYTLLLAVCAGLHAGAQETIDASGGDAQSGSGSVAYSIGQITTSYQTGNGSVNQGVQQPYEFFEVVGTEELDQLSFSVYPNPTEGILFITSDQLFSGTISVMDAQGKLVATETVQAMEKTLDLRTLARGMYTISIQTPNEYKNINIIKH